MPLDLNRIRAFCFDIDGTLRDTDDQLIDQMVKYLTPFNRFFPIQDQRIFARRILMALENPGNFLLQIPDRFGVYNKIAALGDLLLHHRLWHPPKSHTIIAGTIQTLSELVKTYPLAIVSARGTQMTNSFIDHFHLGEYFQILVSAQSCRHTKPFPDPILFVAQHLRISPSECVMVGDTTLDIRAGVAAGTQTIGVLSGFGEEKELNQAGADLILKSVAQIPALFSTPQTSKKTVDK